MKKFAMAAVAVAAMMAGGAQAYTAGTFSNGAVVPNVIHNGSTQFTAVGVVNQTGRTVPVFWTFFDQNSGHITDGCFVVTDKGYRSFNWMAESGNGLENRRGYLVFAAGGSTVSNPVAGPTCADTGHDVTAQIGVHAFQVDTTAQDVAYTPVIDGPLGTNTLGVGIEGDLTTMDNASIGVVAGAAQSGATAATGNARFSMRYYLENGSSTNIVVWSTGRQNRSHTVNIFDNAQNRKSVNFDLTQQELDWFNPATIAGRPANFVDGFIEWNANGALRNAATPPAPVAGSIFTYSVMVAPAFNATQTVLGMHR
jgi:hypothetical protein